MKNIFLILILIIAFCIPSFAEEPILPEGYDKVKLGDFFDSVSKTYNLIKLGLIGPFKSNIYAVQLSDTYIKELNFEFKDNKVIWLCIRYNALNGDWHYPSGEGYGNCSFETMEGRLIHQFGDSFESEEGEQKDGGVVMALWKRWTYENKKIIMEFEGKCKYHVDGTSFAYTKSIYPAELKETLKEIREKDKEKEED